MLPRLNDMRPNMDSNVRLPPRDRTEVIEHDMTNYQDGTTSACIVLAIAGITQLL
jgi:hypothetical protein